MRNTLFITGRIIEKDLRNDLFERLLLLPTKFYQDKTRGDILSITMYDMDSIRYLFGHIIMHFLNIISLYIFAMISLATINIRLTIYAIIPYPLLFITSQKLSKKFFSHYKYMTETRGELSTTIQEIFSSIYVVKSFAQEKSINDLFNNVNSKYVDSAMRLVKLRGLFHPTIMLFAAASYVIILYFGGKSVINGEISVGDFVAFNGTLIFLIRPTVFIGWVVNLVERSRASLGRIDEIMDYKSLVIDNDKTDHSIKSLNGNIEIHNLSYNYADNSSAIADINLKINNGEMVALIGEVGCGKSTILKAMQRTFNIPENTVFFSERELYKIPLKILRESIGYVSQEPIIFSGTIKENIAYSDNNYSDQEIKEAAKTACLEADIEEYDDKYLTKIGESGITLSGGQKQRLSIARALIKKPKILLLDNAFSSIDTETEDKILNNLLKKYKGEITIVMVAHRVSTLKHCNSIILMNNGKITATGTHHSLLKTNKEYRKIYEKQTLS